MTFVEEFRAHFEKTYAGSGEDFERYKFAYEFGRLMSLFPHFKGRSFADAEKYLQAQFEITYPGISFETVREAVRYAFDRSDGIGPYAKAEMVDKMKDPLSGVGLSQIRSGERVQSTKEALETSISMSASVPQPR